MKINWQTVTKKLQDFLSGNFTTKEFLKRQYPFFILIVGLLFFYVYLGHRSQAQQREIKHLRKEIKEARYEMLDLSAEYTQRTLPSHLQQELKADDSNVKESVTSPIIIE